MSILIIIQCLILCGCVRFIEMICPTDTYLLGSNLESSGAYSYRLIVCCFIYKSGFIILVIKVEIQ